MKVVIDTNELLSALISPYNPPSAILKAWLAGRFDLVTSEDQLAEIRRVSRYERLKPFLMPLRAGLLLNKMRKAAVIIGTSEIQGPEAFDPNDNFLIEICESSRANCLLTGDNRAGLLQRQHIGPTEVMTAAQFANRYLSH